MSPLDLKLLRDLARMKGQIVAASLVMACGLAMMIMARSLIHSLESTRDSYYQSYGFPDVFCELKRAPNSLRERLAEIPGIASFETRVLGKVTLDLPGLAEPADGLVLSIPEDRPMQLNRIFLRRGRLPEIGSHGEVVVGEAFADAHGFEPGNELAAIIHGARQRLKIVGVGLAPEFVFEARAGDTFPDPRRFGVFWMNERELATAYELDGAFNSVLVDAAPGQPTAPVMAALDRLLAPYGGLVAYDRTDHASARHLSDELHQLRGLSVVFPLVFLSIGAFMSSAVLSRLVRLQREQIAQLKAFGYSSWQVGAHYLKFSFVLVVIGMSVGGAFGMWFGKNVVEIYQRFFRFPSLTFQPDFSAIGTGLLITTAASVLGVIGAVWQAVRLSPAEAMRPEPPADFKTSLFERLGVVRLASPALRMALRNIERKPWQAAMTLIGLMLATAIPLVPGSVRDGIDYLTSFQWERAQRQDMTVSLLEPGSARTLDDLRHLPGVIRAEPFRSVPARVVFGHRSRRMQVTGFPAGVVLNRQLDAQGEPLALPPDGVLISAELAQNLGASPGDKLSIEVQEGRRPKCEVTIQGLVTDYAGIAAYMDIDSLRRLMREGGTISGAQLAVDTSQLGEFFQQVKRSPRIAALAIKSAVRGSFQKTTAEIIGLLQSLYFSFSVVVAFGVVYNSARIALSERSRDLATLRVVGFTHREVTAVLIGELALLTLAALPLGLGFGTLLAQIIVHSADTELVRLPFMPTTRTYATAVLIVLASALVSFAVVSRRLRALDLLGVLKARE